MQWVGSGSLGAIGPVSVRRPVFGTGDDASWGALCALLVLPLAAMLHHGHYYRATCMLNPFGPDYSLEVVGLWLSRDPSLPLAALLALAVYHVGQRLPGLRRLLPPFLIAFAPLALWVWDLPGTGRLLCETLHDRQILFGDGTPLRGRHLYALGAAAYLPLLAWRWRPRARPAAAESGVAPERAPALARVAA